MSPKAVKVLPLLGLACYAHAGPTLLRELDDSSCFFQQRVEAGSTQPALISDAPPLLRPDLNYSGALRMERTGAEFTLNAVANRTSPAAELRHKTNAEMLVQTFYDAVDVPGWTDGDDTERGITREDRSDIGMDDVWNFAAFPTGNATGIAEADGDEGLDFFKAAPVGAWLFLLAMCILSCLLDCFVLSRLPETFFYHMVAIAIWVLVAAVYNALILCIEGPQQAFQWASGYMLEWMLSMDNLFVFHLVFNAYQTPSDQIHKAAFVGILGAVVMRMFFFMVVSTLLSLFGWFRYPFGLLLIWSGIEAARGDGEDDEMDPRDTRLVKGLTWCLGSRLEDTYDPGGRLFVWSGSGHMKVTLLVVVIACLEFTDILFALDSVSAKVAQIPDQYLAFSSSVLAMFGLRAMFFIIKDLVEMFELLQYGLCIILVFIGMELMFGRMIHLQSSSVLSIIVTVFIVCILASVANKARVERQRASSMSSGKSEKSDTKDAEVQKDETLSEGSLKLEGLQADSTSVGGSTTPPSPRSTSGGRPATPTPQDV